jgi:chemotaxis protein CheZ
MPAPDVAVRIREALTAIQRTDLRDPRLGEVLSLASQLTDAMQAFFGSIDRTMYGELRYIASYIQRTRQEISALRPNDIREGRIPSAGAELDAVVKHTAEATNRIMSAAEAIMSADPSDRDAYDALVQEKVLDIFEACSFQDITGQRVNKVVETLNHIEQRLSRFAHVMGVEDAAVEESDADRRKRELLLNGPALNGPEVKQDDIDAMFDGAGSDSVSSQDDIDALFK